MDLAVPCGKLIDWLLARRLIPLDYTKLLSAVQARVTEAQKEQAGEALQAISEHKEMHYLAAKKVYEVILESPEGGKTMLGTHTHPGAAKWKAVLDTYRRRNLGWASAARFLVQNVGYELPALSKQAAACERQVQDCVARQAELDRQEANARATYRELLAELGVEGLDLRAELRFSSLQELAELSETALELLREGQDTVACYQTFAEAAGRPQGEVLPFIRALCKDPSLEALEVSEFRALRSAQRPAEAPDAPCDGEAPVADIDWAAVSCEGLEVEAPPVGAASLLADAAARELLGREVSEAKAFLAERCGELRAGPQDYGPQQSLAEVEALHKVMSKLEELLSSRRTQRLVLLTSARCLERTVRRVELAKQQCGKFGARRAELERLKAQQVAEAQRSREEAERLQAGILAVKEDLEAELAAHFKSKVRILTSAA